MLDGAQGNGGPGRSDCGVLLGSMRWVIPPYIPYRSGRSFSHSAQPCPAPPIPPPVALPVCGVYSERDAHRRRAEGRARLLIIYSSSIPISFLHLCPRHLYPKFHLEGVLTFYSGCSLSRSEIHTGPRARPHRSGQDQESSHHFSATKPSH